MASDKQNEGGDDDKNNNNTTAVSDGDEKAGDGKKKEKSTKEEQMIEVTKTPKMTVALFIFWVVPVVLLAVVSRFAVDVTPPPVNTNSRPISLDLSKANAKSSSNSMTKPSRKKEKKPKPTNKKAKKQRKPSPSPASSRTKPSSYPSSYPTSYQEVLDTIAQKKRQFNKFAKAGLHSTTKSSASKPSKPTTSPRASTPAQEETRTIRPTVETQSPEKEMLEKQIDKFRVEYEADPNDVWKAINLADALRHKDLKFHDGGMGQSEALEAYGRAIELSLAEKQKLVDAGEPTNKSLSGTTSVKDELMLDMTQKSVDGLLCAIYSNQGKLYFMANMFEKAVESYTQCIEIEPLYLDAVGARGSSRIILGQYEEAGQDFMVVIKNDQHRLFNDAFTGMAKVLSTKEDLVPGGWESIVETIEDLIDSYDEKVVATTNAAAKKMYAEALNRLHHVLYMYHDVKTKDREQAWHHLSSGYKFKMSVLAPFNKAAERQKLSTTKQVFHKDFWPVGIGSDTKLPIFIIGFVRSGSTLLERVLDAHPLIVGTGEDSVFNGRLDHIRNTIVSASLSGDAQQLHTTVRELADSVAVDMRKRWESIEANTKRRETAATPQRFADKMLTNYFNVGFIHMLFPNALILHVARNPMDVLWSAFKHEFPPGGLDYTSEFEGLALMYRSYRAVIDHWDDVLPGRITHIRYEDMVNDMPGMAKAIIKATGLPWDEGVLEFHKKKHAVNTLSTTQVRKGVYKHSMEAWKKYEKQLKPLAKMVGKGVEWDLETSLASYVPPP